MSLKSFPPRIAVFFAGWFVGPLFAVAAEPIDFDGQIRPILSDNCFFCHGPDHEGRQADLRLDTREGATSGGAIVPGKSGESEILKRMLSTDPEVRMPPPRTNRQITPAQAELIAKWIDQGAEWSEHWSFVKPRRPAVPAIHDDNARHNAIDAFVQARLVGTELKPSVEADRARLLRRVTLDLTGLPPTLEELDVYLKDAAPGAYERAVDRLFASPRYGERMVWDWLDAARYADTNGYQGDPTRPMWYWRDWATSAINANQPFDQFSVEQLAGDLLPSPSREQLIATGFHRNHMINGEGGRIAEESRVDYVQDRVETTGTVWLGLTLNCCRCHDHKFDPISQREYYQLAAYFNSIEESGANDAGGLANPVMSLATDEQQQRLQELRSDEQAARQKQTEAEQRVARELPAWEAEFAAKTSSAAGEGTKSLEIQWKPLKPTSLSAQHGTKLSVDEAAVVTASGDNPPQEKFSMLFAPPKETITALRIEALPDDALVNSGPGRADNGNFVLSEVIMEVYGRAIDLDPLRVDFAQDGWPAAHTADGKPATGWAIMPQFGKPHELIIAPRTPQTVPSSEVLTIRLAFESPHVQHVLGKFRVSMTSDRPELVRGMPPAVLAALSKPKDQRSEAEQKAVSDHYVSTHADVIAAKAAADQAKSRREGFERSLPRTMVMRERSQPRETFILVRGAYDKFGDKVTHGTPSVLPAPSAETGANRLALARWLMSPEHPLTSRVVVNRIWQTFFGAGLVKTTEDFGAQGEKPSHPELLDWLAVEFVESGWDVKHLQRLIVTSATYRQSSKVSAHAVEQDPENRLYARGPRYRWPSWMLRDQALAVSGLLQEHLGGPPVKGYQPEGIWEEATFGKITYQQDHGPALHRRSLYQFWRRIVGPTVFFDVAARQYCAVKVARTNTPLHALTTLNDVSYVEAARVFAERILREGGPTDAERLTLAFRLCTSREPTAAELPVLQRRLGQLRTLYAADAAAVDALLKVGETPVDPSVPRADLAAWTSIGSLLMNLDETLSKE